MDLKFLLQAIKQKTNRKIIWSVFFLLGLFFADYTILAQEADQALLEEISVVEEVQNNEDLAPITPEEVTVVPTQTVQPLQIIVNDPEPGLPFSGEILSRRYFEAEKVVLQLFDDDGFIVWEGEIPLGEEEVRVIPYYFVDVEARGELRLVVKAEGSDDETLAMGERPVEFPYGTETTKITDVSLVLEEDNTSMVFINLEAGAFHEAFVPHIKIYKEKRLSENLYYEYDDLPVKVSPQERKKIGFKVDKFLPTGLYVFDIGLKEFRTKAPVPGYFQRTIFSPGDYIRLTRSSVFHSEKTPEYINLNLQGVAFFEVNQPLKATVAVVDKKDLVIEKKADIELENGYFNHTLQFSLADIRSDFTGKIDLRSEKGEALASKDFNFSDIEVEVFENFKNLPPVQKPKEEDTNPPAPEVTSVVESSSSQDWIQILKSNQLYIYAGGGILLVIILLIVVLSRRHNLWLITAGASVAMPVISWGIAIPFYPTVEWIQPNTTALSAYNPDSESGFEIMRVEGRVYNGLTGESFFKTDIIKEWRINFVDSQGKLFQFSLEEDFLADGLNFEKSVRTGFYRFYLDLSKIEGAFPLGEESPFVFSEGNWRTQLLFKFYDAEASVNTWYATDFSEDLSRFVIDRTAPQVSLRMLGKDGEPIPNGTFTNQPVEVEVSCQDTGSTCLWEKKKFPIFGNFCADGTKCDNTAAREIVVCDLAQNCESHEISIDYYDPIPPKLDFFQLGGEGVQRVESAYEMMLRYQDPRKTVEIDDNLFLPHVCAAESSGFFLDKAENRCYPKRYPCVFKDKGIFVRGENTGHGCAQSCPIGFEFKNGSCQVPCNNQSFLSGEMCFPLIFSNN